MYFNYFNISQEINSTTGNYYPVAIPTNGFVDVYSDHHWKMGSSLTEIPSIYLKEYKLEYGRWTSSIVRSLQTVKSLINSTWQDPYKDMYLAEETGFAYNLPYLKDNKTIKGQIQNSWSSNDAGVFQVFERVTPSFAQGKFKNVAPTMYKFANTLGSGLAAGWGVEPLVNYKQTNCRSLNLTFPLYNTLDLESANDNFSFITLFNFQNLKTRTSWTTYLPPKMYSVETQAEGGIYMPLAYVKSFTVYGLGQLREMKDFGSLTSSGFGGGLLDFFGNMGVSKNFGRLIPEAYKVVIGLEEVIPESVNIAIGSLGHRKVTVTRSPGEIQTISSGSSLAEIGTQLNNLAELNVPVQMDPKLQALADPNQVLYGKPLPVGADTFDGSRSLGIGGLSTPGTSSSAESLRTKGISGPTDSNSSVTTLQQLRVAQQDDPFAGYGPTSSSSSQASTPSSSPKQDPIYLGIPGPGFVTQKQASDLPLNTPVRVNGVTQSYGEYLDYLSLPVQSGNQVISSQPK